MFPKNQLTKLLNLRWKPRFLIHLLSVLLSATAICFCWQNSPVYAAETLTNSDVIDMFKAGMSSEIVAEKIRLSNPRFDISAKALIELHNANVPDNIVNSIFKITEEQEKSVSRAIALAIPNLASDRPEVRQQAMNTLRSFPQYSIPALVKSLNNPNANIRRGVVGALAEFQAPEGVEYARTMLRDVDPGVRIAVADYLFIMEDSKTLSRVPSEIRLNRQPIDAYFRLAGLLELNECASAMRLAIHDNDDPACRTQAVIALGVFGATKVNREAVEFALLRDRSVEVRKAAAESLAKLADPQSTSVLIVACNQDPAIRIDLIKALAKMSALRVVPFIINVMEKDITPDEMESCIATLRRLTFEDFGHNTNQWRSWWESNRLSFTDSKTLRDIEELEQNESGNNYTPAPTSIPASRVQENSPAAPFTPPYPEYKVPAPKSPPSDVPARISVQ